MSRFDLQANEEVSIEFDGHVRRFRAVPHPNAPGQAHAMEGGKAIVYHLRDTSGTSEYALKVMKRIHRHPDLVQICDRLDQLKAIPGFSVCERFCLSPNRSRSTLASFGDLLYAIFMPWIVGNSWFDLLFARQNGRYQLTKKDSLQLALNFSTIIVHLEKSGRAHCDISAGNLLVDRQTYRMELIDTEDIYFPNTPPPTYVRAAPPVINIAPVTMASGTTKPIASPEPLFFQKCSDFTTNRCEPKSMARTTSTQPSFRNQIVVAIECSPRLSKHTARDLQTC
ncbi:MAG: hypothetical protein HC897_03845 [Thermoanaerobaculia bacterium]|nr:hypothetical protein [Thermoanaerobaculia bacterium]